MLRAICQQKASATSRTSTSPRTRRTPMERSLRRVELPGRWRQKAAKSCSPTSGAAAERILSRSSGRGQASTYPRVSGSGPPESSMRYT